MDGTVNINKIEYNKLLDSRLTVKPDYDLIEYYKKIPNYSTITTLPEENAEYIKEALPNVDNCSGMMGFGDGCKALTSIDTTGWDTSNIIYMNCMFDYCESLTSLDVSKFDTSKVINMNGMFDYCKSLTTLDASNWDTSNVTKMFTMFYYCKSLTTLDLSNWDTSNVDDMNDMFGSCHALTAIDISNWDTSNVTKMKAMFGWCDALTTIKGVIDMKSCTYYDDMFFDCTKLTGVKIKNPPEDFETKTGLTKDQYEIVE